MLELLAGLALAVLPPAESAYRQTSLTGFVAVENRRPVDGIDYSDGNGALNAGLLYARPEGLFAGTELLMNRGDGLSLPENEILTLQSFAGYAWTLGDHRFALEFLDYRLDASNADRVEHRGVGLRYHGGRLVIEYAHENNKPYFHHYYEQFFRYDVDRIALGWKQPLTDRVSWSLGAGASRIDGIEVEYHYVVGKLHWTTGGIHWQAGYSLASDELEGFYGPDLDRGHWLLRAALPFRVF